MKDINIDKTYENYDKKSSLRQLLIIKKDKETIQRDRDFFAKNGYLNNNSYCDLNLRCFREQGFDVNDIIYDFSYSMKKSIFKHSHPMMVKNNNQFFAEATSDFISHYMKTLVFEFYVKNNVCENEMIYQKVLEDNIFQNILDVLIDKKSSQVADSDGIFETNYDTYSFLDYHIIEIFRLGSDLDNVKYLKEKQKKYEIALKNFIDNNPNVVLINFNLKQLTSFSIIKGKQGEVEKDEQFFKNTLNSSLINKSHFDYIIRMIKEKLETEVIIRVLLLNEKEDQDQARDQNFYEKIIDLLRKYVKENNVEFLNKIKNYCCD